MNIIDLVIPSRVWTDVCKIGPWICDPALGGIAKQAIEELVIPVMEVIINPHVALKSVVDRRLADRDISEGYQIPRNAWGQIGAYKTFLDLAHCLEAACGRCARRGAFQKLCCQ